MRILTRQSDSAQVELSTRELVTLSNAQNEVRNGVRELERDEEFRARLGTERSEARKLLAEMRSAPGPIR